MIYFLDGGNAIPKRDGARLSQGVVAAGSADGRGYQRTFLAVATAGPRELS